MLKKASAKTGPLCCCAVVLWKDKGFFFISGSVDIFGSFACTPCLAPEEYKDCKSSTPTCVARCRPVCCYITTGCYFTCQSAKLPFFPVHVFCFFVPSRLTVQANQFTSLHSSPSSWRNISPPLPFCVSPPRLLLFELSIHPRSLRGHAHVCLHVSPVCKHSCSCAWVGGDAPRCECVCGCRLCISR